ncbi:hypothetical protein QDY63_10805 [Pseudomonas brenneri]|uniref:hypothetical protein n=1 Tax=Pseudomonas brenneri TaxID=129817 RepID=UPI0025A22281|nr:hypothetical protein [Pseudomonas brenneri]WJM93336.1 hypothetical protein QDY63_10805 [Pseudomonas brenneri]
MNNQFEAGQTVYSIHGESASFVAQTSSGYAVEPIYEHEDGEPHYGQVKSWPEVYAEPPVAKLHGKVQELEARINERRKELNDLSSEKRTMESDLASMRRRHEENDQLRNLDLWISGAVTHLVKIDHYSGFLIGTVESILGYDSDKEMRLLSIYGGTKNHYRWKMAAYSDGSGSNTEVLLATSEEEARQVAAKWYAKEVASRARNNQDHVVISLARSAMKYGIPVSDELREKVAKSEVEGRKRIIESAQKEFERAKQRLDEAVAAASLPATP